MHNFRHVAVLALAISAGLGLAPPAAGATVLAFPDVEQPVNVSVGFNTQLPLSDLSLEALAETQKAGREYPYRMAQEECPLLEATIAETCRLTSLNINTQIQQHRKAQPLLNINGNASFSITLKDAAPGAN